MQKITVIGSGPGGMDAALTAAQNGAQVTIIEDNLVGGTCLNSGCIPTKVYLAGANLLNNIENSNFYGVTTEDTRYAQEELLERKNNAVSFLVDGVIRSFKDDGINLIRGRARIKDKNTVTVKTNEGDIDIESDKIIIATGSTPVMPEIFKYDGDKVITSNEILELDNLPESIIIIGGNVVACEVAQYLNRFGVKVTVIEALKHLVPFEDADIARQLIRVLKREGISVFPKTRVSEVDFGEDYVNVKTEDGKEFSAEKVLVCIGRKPNTEGLGLKELGIELDPKGHVVVDDHLETNIDGIYAIGDILNTPMLAHVASYEGMIAAKNACGIEAEATYRAVPRCIYTEPEIAAVGITEEEAKSKNIEYNVATYNFKLLGKAHVVNKARGMVKVITDSDSVIIGASIVGSRASEILQELTLAVNLGLKAKDIANTIHPHPTFSESIMQVCKNL